MATATASPARSATPLVLMLFAATFINYVDRGMVAVAAPLIKAEMGLSATAFGIAVSAFFWTYAPTQVIVGWMVDRFRVERVLAGGVALWGGATAATALVNSFAPLVALRVALGLGESVAFPASSKLIARHVPPANRGVANAAIGAGLAFGPAFGTLVGGLVMAAFGWRALFALFGVATLLWLLPWHFMTRRAPADAADGPSDDHVTFGAILRCPTLWAQCVGHFTSNYGFYFLLAWLPLYLVEVRGFSLAAMASVAAATYAAQGISALLAGWASDRLIARGADEPRVRKALMVIGHVGAAVGTLAVMWTDSRLATFACLVLAGAATGLNSVGVFLIGQTFAGPRAAGRWIGVQNFIGNLSGVVGPVVTGAMIDATGGDYFGGFALAAGVSAFGALCWAFVVPRIEPIRWRAGPAAAAAA